MVQRNINSMEEMDGMHEMADPLHGIFLDR